MAIKQFLLLRCPVYLLHLFACGIFLRRFMLLGVTKSLFFFYEFYFSLHTRFLADILLISFKIFLPMNLHNCLVTGKFW